MQQPLVIFRRLLAFALICIGLGAAPAYALIPIGKASISGQVVDSNGLPVADVVVRVKGPLPLLVIQKTNTTPGGFYSFTGISPEQKVQVSFSKAGFAPSQGSVSLQRQAPGKGLGLLVKLQPATLNKTLLTSGAVQTLNPTQGGTLAEKGFKVSFAPNSITGTANTAVDVVISPIDVSTAEAAAAPGDYSAQTLAGQTVQLESFSMADFTLTQAGKKVNLKAGATAQIELLLPTNTPLKIDDETPMWYFDTNKGVWQEEGRGRVGESTSTPNRLAVFANVKHFTFWNSDQPLNSTEVTGRVIDGNGQELSLADMEGFGVDYAGHSYAVPTNDQGVYCIKIKSNAQSQLKASINLAGTHFESAGLLVNAGQANNSCANGTAQQLPDIVLSVKLACVEGNVKDEQNQPVAGVTVFTSAGSYGTTDASGAFHLRAPENSSIKVSTNGYPAKVVTTTNSGAACAVAELRPNTGTGLACITGTVYQCGPDNPISGRTVKVISQVGDVLLGSSQPTDANGTYCVDGLPGNQDVVIDSGSNYDPTWQTNTGNGGGTCATQTCNAAPDLNVDCY